MEESTRASARDTRAAWVATLKIGDALRDTEYQLRALWGIWGSHVNRGEFKQGLAVAKRFSSLAETASDANDRLVAEFFAIKNGFIQEIQAVLFNLPDAKPTGWPAGYGPGPAATE